MGQGFITNWGRFVLLQIGASVITNWGSLIITKWGGRYYKLGQQLQIRVTVITNWGGYYKLGQTLLQIGAIITNWGITASAYFPYFRAIPFQRYCTWSQLRYLALMAFIVHFASYFNKCFPAAKIWWNYSGKICFFNAMLRKRLFKTFVWGLSSVFPKQWK